MKGAVDDDVAEGKRAFNNAEFGYRIFSKSRLLKGFLAAESVIVLRTFYVCCPSSGRTVLKDSLKIFYCLCVFYYFFLIKIRSTR